MPSYRRGRVLPARRQQGRVGDQRAQERQHDALPGRPHAVQPEPARGGDGLQDDEREEDGVRTDRRRAGQQQAEHRGERGGLHPGFDDRGTAFEAGPLGVGDAGVAGEGGETVGGVADLTVATALGSGDECRVVLGGAVSAAVPAAVTGGCTFVSQVWPCHCWAYYCCAAYGS
ncbi:hypothetical protein H1V43_39390 [Streptomyces sp. PSKA54]|uniref:Uncharacterized protein n=1 Tax=Streptomyces himalayensis subsp. aureolus TaxID=2758039 RepID=A0A7W2D9G6_9ACTN|nr:hypothetical protein [Streptomyces himalayensis subsp. aureolus]